MLLLLHLCRWYNYFGLGVCVCLLQGRRLYILWDGIWSASVCRFCSGRAVTPDCQVAWNAERVYVAGSRSAARVSCIWIPSIQAGAARQACSTVSSQNNVFLSSISFSHQLFTPTIIAANFLVNDVSWLLISALFWDILYNIISLSLSPPTPVPMYL